MPCFREDEGALTAADSERIAKEAAEANLLAEQEVRAADSARIAKETAEAKLLAEQEVSSPGLIVSESCSWAGCWGIVSWFPS